MFGKRQFRIGYNKYLKELGIKKSDYPFDRDKKNKYKRKTGFNDYLTWSFDYNLVLFAYCYIRRLQEVSTVINWEWHKERKEFDFDKILKGLKIYLTKDKYDMTEEDIKEFKKSWKYLGDHMGYLWW